MLRLERFREAVDDYRYLQKLDEVIEASADSVEKVAAQSWLQNTLDAILIGNNRTYGWQIYGEISLRVIPID